MTPFSEAQSQLKPSLWDRLSARRTPLVFALCVLIGLAMVAVRAKGRLEAARAMARTEARACGATLELQFSQVAGAGEALGSLARQGGGAIGNSKWLQEVLRRAQLAELPRQGYDFVFYIPPPFQPKPVPIAAQGLSSLQDTVQQPVRVRNLELRLALKPRGGWINRSQVGLESLGVLLISALVALSVNLIEGRRAIEAELKEATQRLAREAADRSQAQADWTAEKERAAAAKVELRQVQAALQQAESKATQAQAQLEASIQTRAETAEIHKAELKRSRAALQESQETTAQVRALLNAAAAAEKEAASVARERLQQDQATMADLHNRLEAMTRLDRDSAEKNTARLTQLEHSNRELQEQLLAAQLTQARVTELEGLLERAERELRHRDEAPPRSGLVATVESADAHASATAGDDPSRDVPVESTEDPNSAPALSAREPGIAPVDEPIADVNPSADAHQELTEPPASVSGNPAASDEANSGSSMETVEPPAPEASPSEPSPVHKAAKPGKRKQTRRDDQLALFGNEASPGSPVNQELVEAEAQPAPAPEAAEKIQRAASAVAPQDSRAIENSATGDDLVNVGDDPESHLSALRRFAEDHALAPDQIRDALLQGDLPLAQRVLEALQAAAEKIGATGVHQAATALARACHEHADPGEIELVWSELERGVCELVATFKPVALPKEDKPAPSRRLPPAPPVDPIQLRRAVNLILPLLAERDPGAKDCLKDNRTTFRSTFTPEAYVEFEQLVKSGEFEPALEQLRKAVRKHGISL